MALLRYLKKLHEVVQNKNTFFGRNRKGLCSTDGEIKLVLGNSSADLDSVCSALVFAYIFYRVLKAHTGSNVWVVPVINICKADFRLRLAIIPFLESVFNTPTENLTDLLFFQDDPSLCRVVTEEGREDPGSQRVEVALVDHNLGQGMDSTGWPIDKKSVRIVIDHHKAIDEADARAKEEEFPSHLRNWRGEPFTWITSPKIGSTASLIGLLWKHACGAYVPLEDHIELRKLLAAAIVRDTMNLDARLQGIRWTQLDAEALLWVNEGRPSPSDSPVVQGPSTLDPATFLQSYDAVQASVSAHLALTLPEILRMDAKSYTYPVDPLWKICISSLSVSLVELLTALCEKLPPDVSFVDELNAYTSGQQAHVLILMSLTRSPGPVLDNNTASHGLTSPRSVGSMLPSVSRELAVFFPFTTDSLRKKQICEALDAIPELQLEPLDVKLALCWPEHFRLFRQKNLHISRKVFEPHLRAILSRRC